MKWATGVTVAPRKNPTFDKCYQSFLDSGFKPHVFKEPGVSIHPDFLINGVTERMYTLLPMLLLSLYILQDPMQAIISGVMVLFLFGEL